MIKWFATVTANKEKQINLQQHEQKVVNAETLREQAELAVKKYTLDDFDSYEISKAIEDDASMIAFAIKTQTSVVAEILEICINYWFDEKVNEYIESANNWKGE